MEPIILDVFQPAQIVFPLLDEIDFEVEPETSIDIFASTASVVFDNGVRADADITLTGLSGGTLDEVRVFDPSGDPLLTIRDAMLMADAELNILNWGVLSNIEINLSDADLTLDNEGFAARDPDIVDARAWLDLLAEIAATEPEIPLDDILTDIVVDFGGQELPADANNVLRTAGDVLIYDLARADVTVDLAEDGTVSIETADGTAQVTDLEELELTDGTYLYGRSEDADFVYRVYSAVLGRTPDRDGFLFWDDAVEQGTTRRELAETFEGSAEFRSILGEDLSNEAVINTLFQAVLGREADAGGLAFWLGQLDNGLIDRPDLLTAFTNNDENFANTAADIEDGFWVTT